MKLMKSNERKYIPETRLILEKSLMNETLKDIACRSLCTPGVPSLQQALDWQLGAAGQQ